MENSKPRPGKRARPERDTHRHLLAWLAMPEHKHLSILGIEKDIKMPRGLLSKAIKGTEKLPAKHYAHLVGILACYGYVPIG